MNGPIIMFFGNLTQDPEQRYTRNEAVPYTRVRVACNRYSGPERSQETYYFSANLWGNDAEQCLQKCRKGSFVYLQGHYSQSEYTRRDGSPGIDYHVNAQEFQHFEWLRSSPNNQEKPESGPTPDAEPAEPEDAAQEYLEDEDLPEEED